MRKSDKELAAFDLDGTLIRKNSSLAFVSFLTEVGFFSKRDLLFCLRCYLHHRFFNLSLLNLHQKVLKRLFCGKSIAELTPLVEVFIKKKIEGFWYDPALLRLRWLKQQGVTIMILSNAPTFLVRPIAREIGIDTVFGTEYCLDRENRLQDIATLIDGEEKAKLLKQQADLQQKTNTSAFSDSLLDLPFLQAATKAIAVNPKPSLKRVAKRCGWEVL